MPAVPVRLLRPVLLLALLACLAAGPVGGLLGLGARAHADDPTVAVPVVEGSLLDNARATLEALGLRPAVVTVAGMPAGRVARQEPPAGTPVPFGSEVVLRVGIALRVDTRVPEVRGQRLADVGPELEAAYVLEVELVDGPADQAGRIVDLQPAPGQALLFRGVLMLRVIHAAAPEALGVVVPALLGRTEAQALETLQVLGLSAAVEYVEDAARPRGTVLSQHPASGTEMLVGGTVTLRVAGTPQQPVNPAPGLPAPNLVGLSMNAALEAAQAVGLVPQVQFQVVGGQAAFTCVQQNPAAGTPLAPGATVTLVVALPGAQPSQVTVPTLFGLSQAQASQLLAQLGLGALAQPSVSGYPAGMVFSQDPPAGAVVPKGAAVRVFVAVPGVGPLGAKVPSVLGLTAAQAFQTLKQAGFQPKGRTHLAPGAPVDVVGAQQPVAGATVALGSEVQYYVPATSLVPALFGRTKGEAIQLLQDAGFNPKPQGPAFGMGTTVVIAQGAPAGVPLARGSEVGFAFKFEAGGGIPVKVQVPNLLGQTKNQAVQTLQQKGLGVDLDHQGPFLPGSGTKVVGQNPPAGALVNAGAVVKVAYVDVAGGGGPGLVVVPDLSGLTQQAAQQALQQAGLPGQFVQQGPAFPGGTTKVISQQPVGGQPVPPGTLVKVTFVSQPGLAQKVAVPNLVNLTLAQAEQALAAKNLQGQFSQQGPNLPLGQKVVVSQQIPPGTLVNPGTTVQAVYVLKPSIQPPAQKVAVPKVTGLWRAQAQQALAAAGLTATFQGGGGNPAKQRVISQNPPQGTLVDKGSNVVLFVIQMP